MTQIVGSTASGSGAAQADFVLRQAKQAKDIESLQPYLEDVAVSVNTIASRDTVIVECSQGTFLSLALSPDYPFLKLRYDLNASRFQIDLDTQH